MTSQQRSEYIRECVRAIYGREPEDMLPQELPRGEIAVVETWCDRGIPLRTILQTVEQMPKHPSVRYIRDAVELEEERRRRALGA